MKIRKKTIYEYFSEEEIFWEKTPKELSVIAGKFGMKNDFFYSNQTMGSLSGGEKVKTQLMRLFIRDVSVLLLDEPSNDIDIATLTLLEKIINDWKHIVLFISHDETLIVGPACAFLVLTVLRRGAFARSTVPACRFPGWCPPRVRFPPVLARFLVRAGVMVECGTLPALVSDRRSCFWFVFFFYCVCASTWKSFSLG